MTLLLAHFLVLTAVSYAVARRLVQEMADRLIATLLLFWGNIVVLSLGLSVLGHLDHPAWFFRGSFLLALVTLLLARGLSTPSALRPAPAGEPRSILLILAAGLTLGAMAFANLAIAWTYEPSNYDSLTYHLPRVMYYLGHNSLGHFETADFRQVYYPFNFNLLQLLCLVYDAPSQAITFCNVAMWAVTGLAVYRIARLAGHSFNASLLAAWLCLSAQEILAQGTSTILDLPAGAALVRALVFGLRWRESRRAVDAFFVALAVSMSVGTKLTAAFFGPAAAVIGLALFWHHWRERRTGAFFTGVRGWIGPALLAAALTVPFVLYNLKAAGEPMTHRMDFTLNKPFTLACALQTAQGYLVQIFCEPLGRFTLDIEHITALNEWFKAHVFTNWNPAHAFSDLYLIPPDLNEDHVFFGFAGPLFLCCAVWCLARDWRLRGPIAWAAMLGLGWFVFYFATNKWSLYNQRYFVPPMAVLAPCVAAAWDAGRRRWWLRLVFWAVTACGLWFAGHYLLRNTIRPVPFGRATLPNVIPGMPARLVERLSTQPRVNINTYGTNERIFPLMRLAPRQRFTSGQGIDPAKYNLFSYWQNTRNYIFSNLAYFASYTLVPVPGKQSAGVEFLGAVDGVGDNFDYVGLVPHANDQPPTKDNIQIAVVVEYDADAGHPQRLRDGRIRIIGLNPRDAAHVEISADLADGTNLPLLSVAHSDWTPLRFTQPFKRLVLRVVRDADGVEIGAGELPYTIRQSDFAQAAFTGPGLIFATELVTTSSVRTLTLEGLAPAEGPYSQWDLPMFRWAKQPVVRLSIPPNPKVKRLRLSLSARLQVRDDGVIDIFHNGRAVQSVTLRDRHSWVAAIVEVPVDPGENVIELRNRPLEDSPDWTAYLEQNLDVKQYLLSQKLPLEEGAKQHYELHGRPEGRSLPVRTAAMSTVTNSLYFAYRSLRIEGLAAP